MTDVGFLRDSVVKNPPAKQEMAVRSLGREDPLEEETATHSSILAWRILMDRGAWWATIHRVAESQVSNYTATKMKQVVFGFASPGIRTNLTLLTEPPLSRLSQGQPVNIQIT